MVIHSLLGNYGKTRRSDEKCLSEDAEIIVLDPDLQPYTCGACILEGQRFSSGFGGGGRRPSCQGLARPHPIGSGGQDGAHGGHGDPPRCRGQTGMWIQASSFIFFSVFSPRYCVGNCVR
jgi:hypothetical protein